ncbi:ribonuclease P protein component [Actinomyces sp. zg-332]|nr:ribonuclease P protein component [Actinomyces sp. zg-332]
MKNPSDFLEVIRNGVRVSNKYMVVHYKTDKRNVATPLVGFVVPKKQLPKAVDRNRVKRQFRHIFAGKIGKIDSGTHIVIRILADAKGKKSFELEKKLDIALKRAKEKMDNRVDKSDSLVIQ